MITAKCTPVLICPVPAFGVCLTDVFSKGYSGLFQVPEYVTKRTFQNCWCEIWPRVKALKLTSCYGLLATEKTVSWILSRLTISSHHRHIDLCHSTPAVQRVRVGHGWIFHWTTECNHCPCWAETSPQSGLGWTRPLQFCQRMFLEVMQIWWVFFRGVGVGVGCRSGLKFDSLSYNE